jgi:hypothetical protein
MNMVRTDNNFASQVEQAKQAIRNADAERAAYIRAGGARLLLRVKVNAARLGAFRPKGAQGLQRI